MKQEGVYRIVVEGYIDKKRIELFEGMDMVYLPGGGTQLQGIVQDQAHLHAVLSKVRDLGLILLLVERKDTDK